MEKIKQFLESETGKDVLIILIVILVGSGSFKLGRLSKETGSTGVKILSADEAGEYSDQASSQPANVIQSTALTHNTSIPSGKNYFASSRGSKYYTLGCSAGKSIKQENRVYFGSADEAEKAGYSLSASCD